MNADADDWRRRAIQASREGRTADAIDASERLLRICPDDADGWYRLAYQCQQAGHHERALQAYDQALAHAVRDPDEVHLNRALSLGEGLGRWAEAEQALRQALALQPQRVSTWISLGQLHERLGRSDAARQAYRQVLDLSPGQAQALARMLALTAPNADDAQPWLEQAQQALADTRTPALDRADLGFALGQALDSLGCWDQAFERYRAANRASREAAGGVCYDARAQERFVDHLIETFPLPGAPVDASAVPVVWICGPFRSGSTLVERMLAAHPSVRAGGELAWLPQLAGEHLRAHGGRFEALDGPTLEAMRQRYQAQLRARFPGPGLVTDKRPDNMMLVGLVKTLFPAARIVLTRRHALDNALALFFLHLSPSMPYALDLDDIAHWLLQLRRLQAHWKACWGDSVHTVDYDRLVRQPRAEVQALLDFLGLPWHDACLQFERGAQVDAVATASLWQVRQPLYTRSSGRWRHYERQLGGLRHKLLDAQAADDDAGDAEGSARPG